MILGYKIWLNDQVWSERIRDPSVVSEVAKYPSCELNKKIEEKMKFAFALCLVLASSCLALVPKHPDDMASMLARQQFAVRSMMAAPSIGDNSLADECFNNYMVDQTNAVMSYNKQYTGCNTAADQSRSELTAESAAERANLLDRTNNMCTDLTACEAQSDGLDFFDCYRDAVSIAFSKYDQLGYQTSGVLNRLIS